MKKNSSQKQPQIDISSIGSQLVEVSDVHLNVNQEVVITTEDKMRLCLTQHLARMERKKAWIAPAGIFLALVTSLLTTNFTDIWLKATTWQAIFIISAALSCIWFLTTIKDAFASETMDNVIEELKKSKIQPALVETEVVKEVRTIDVVAQRTPPE